LEDYQEMVAAGFARQDDLREVLSDMGKQLARTQAELQRLQQQLSEQQRQP
jgi:hypothetical protein